LTAEVDPKAEQKKFAFDILTRAGTQGLLQLRNLIFLPLIAKTLGPEAYGAWTQVNVTLNLAVPVVMLRLEMACVRYLSTKQGRGLSEEFFGMALLVWALVLALAGIGFWMRDGVRYLLFSAEAPILYAELFLLLFVIRTSFTFVLNYYRALNEIRRYSLFELGANLGSIGLAVALMLEGFELPGVLTALIAVEGGASLLVLADILRQVGLPRRLLWVRLGVYLRYSLPLLPNRLMFWVLNFSDRYLITHLLGLGLAGVYAASYALGNLATLLQGPITFVLLPTVSKLFDRGEQDEVKRYMRASLKLFLLFSVPSAVGIYHFAPQILRILATSAFVTDRLLILFVLLGFICLGIHQIFIYVIHLHERTRSLPLITVVTAALNVGLNLVLLPTLGILGAAVSTFVAYVVQMALVIRLSSRLLWIGFEGRFALKAFLASLGMYGVLNLWTPHGLGQLALAIALGAAVYFALLVALKGIGRREWRWVRSAVARSRS